MLEESHAWISVWFKLKSGLISFIQYMMLKPIKHGLESFALCCSKNGYLFTVEVYTGKDNTADGSAYETAMRMLSDSGIASRGRGRTLLTEQDSLSLHKCLLRHQVSIQARHKYLIFSHGECVGASVEASV
jgi:hypothetical protein